MGDFCLISGNHLRTLNLVFCEPQWGPDPSFENHCPSSYIHNFMSYKEVCCGFAPLNLLIISTSTCMGLHNKPSLCCSSYQTKNLCSFAKAAPPYFPFVSVVFIFFVHLWNWTSSKSPLGGSITKHDCLKNAASPKRSRFTDKEKDQTSRFLSAHLDVARAHGVFEICYNIFSHFNRKMY